MNDQDRLEMEKTMEDALEKIKVAEHGAGPYILNWSINDARVCATKALNKVFFLRHKDDIPPLKPCPFCGSKADMRRMRNEYYPQCTQDKSKGFCILGRFPGPEDGFTFEKDAVACWNKRP